MSNIARQIAEIAHKGQVRKYSGAPYIDHPALVADLVTVSAGSPEQVAAAWLHDVLEDTAFPAEMLAENVGSKVLGLVQQLTFPSAIGFDRAARHELRVAQIEVMTPEAKLVKLADITANLADAEHLVAASERFARLYLAEKRDELDSLMDAGDLYDHASKLWTDAVGRLV